MTEERTITPLNEVDIDMEAAADALFLGPQASLIEKIRIKLKNVVLTLYLQKRCF